MSARRRFPWGKFYLGVAVLLAAALAVGFVLQYLGIWTTSAA